LNECKTGREVIGNKNVSERDSKREKGRVGNLALAHKKGLSVDGEKDRVLEDALR